MAKRGTGKVQSDERVKLPPKRVRLRLLDDMTYKVKTPSGHVYVFNGAGSEVDVYEEDVAFLLSKKRRGSCCGGGVTGMRPLFEEA